MALDVNDRMAVERYMDSLNLTLCDDLSQPSTTPAVHTLSIKDVMGKLLNSGFVDMVFEQLALAPRKKYKDTKMSGDLSAACLTALAPGVFHMPYLKVWKHLPPRDHTNSPV